MVNKLEREIAEVSRSTEFFNISDLQKQTGQPQDNFASVVVKELLDNAADHCETVRDDPEISLEITNGHDGCIVITVTDNGLGMSPETLDKILKNFDVKVSDKVNYKSPSRGQQGNALKTIIGMPYALNLSDPVIIETRGVKHSIYVKPGAFGGVETDHTTEDIGATVGTKITVTLPGFTASHLEPSAFWAKSYALFNPNITVTFQGEPRGVESRKVCQKFTATDLTAPAWYDLYTFKNQVAAKVNDNSSSLLRNFVMTFRGLSRSTEAKAVCDQLPEVKYLSKLTVETIPRLLQVMKDTAKEPSPKILGQIGKDHFRDMFNEQFGGIARDRFYYKHNECVVDGIPYVIEAAAAEVESLGRVLHGLNYSPTFSDPLAGGMLYVLKNGITIIAPYGLNGMIQACYADPHRESPANNQNVVTALHIISPGLEFTDRGKTNLKLPHKVSLLVADTLWYVLKTFYEQGKRIERDAAREQRRIEREEARLEREARGDTDTMNDAVDTVLWDAYIETSQNETLPTSARDLYYAVRRWIQDHTSEELDYKYFTKLLVTWQQEHETKLTKLYYDPRGYLIEPDGTTTQLGTRAKASSRTKLEPQDRALAMFLSY